MLNLTQVIEFCRLLTCEKAKTAVLMCWNELGLTVSTLLCEPGPSLWDQRMEGRMSDLSCSVSELSDAH